MDNQGRFICNVCGNNLKIIDSRPYGNQRKRRYECEVCRMRYSSIETIVSMSNKKMLEYICKYVG